jgi:hypothetical protein
MSSKGWGVLSADVGVFTNHQSVKVENFQRHLSGLGLGVGAFVSKK